VPWGVIAALGCAGLIAAGRRWPAGALALGILVAVQSVFFVTTRYRLALLPILALFAGMFVMELIRAKGRRRVVLAGVLLVCALATVPWGLQRPVSNLRTAGLAHAGVSALALAQHELDSGDDARASLGTAVELLEQRLDHDAGDAETRRHLARAWYLQEDAKRAERVLREGLDPASRTQEIHADLVRLLHATGQTGAVLDELLVYLRAHPQDADMWHLNVYLPESEGRTEDALGAAQLMHRLVPEDSRAWSNLGVALARRGQLQEARDVLRAGLERFPQDTVIRENLVRVESAPR
jgi:Flp pilus assembly protein TadD